MRIRFWCNHCGEFDKSVNIELDEIGAYTIAPKFCPKCMFVLKHADVAEIVKPVTDTGPEENEVEEDGLARPTVTKQDEQTANDNKANAEGTVS